MHDIKTIIADWKGFDAALARRGLKPMAKTLIDLDAARREAITEENRAKSELNALSARIATLMQSGQRAEGEKLREEARGYRDLLPEMSDHVRRTKAQFIEAMAAIPNALAPDVPDGKGEGDNVVLRLGRLDPVASDFDREHFDIGAATGLMDFDRAARMSGSRFTVLRGPLARLSRALGQFMIDLHTRDHGYEEVEAPLIVGRETLFGTGQLPKFESDLYKVTGETDTDPEARQFLIPTAEVTLTNLVAGEILKREKLPLRFTALTPCFRSEAGSAGRDTRGMLRQHQFSKCELVTICEPLMSKFEHERMLECAEAVLKALGLPYRIMTLCAGDTGFSAQKTYDIEVWLPGQKRYREISSVSNCGPFQALRMNTRIKDEGGDSIPVHTLNGSGVAVGRALIAVMENYQIDNDKISVPSILHPYMAGATTVGGLKDRS